DAQAAALEARRVELQAAVNQAGAELGRRQEEHARVEAKVRRTEIERRAAHDAARAAAGPDAKFAPPEHARRIAEIEAELAARTGEAKPLEAARRAAEEALAAHEAPLRRVTGEIAAI